MTRRTGVMRSWHLPRTRRNLRGEAGHTPATRHSRCDRLKTLLLVCCQPADKGLRMSRKAMRSAEAAGVRVISVCRESRVIALYIDRLTDTYSGAHGLTSLLFPEPVAPFLLRGRLRLHAVEHTFTNIRNRAGNPSMASPVQACRR
jgi:hypothetical protein